jgi:molecular chaperone GrpE
MMRKRQARSDEKENVDINEVAENKDFISKEEQEDKPVEDAESGEMATEKGEEVYTETTATGEASAAKEAVQEQSIESKLAEMQDRYIRLSAEFDNYRKRTLREKIDLTKNAGENLLLSLVPVMDDFERALKSMENSSDCVALRDGIDLIYNKFRDFLKQNGIKEIEALHSDFNVDLHEAISKVPAEDESLKGKVVDVVQKGYWLNEKVMRFAKVIVGE